MKAAVSMACVDGDGEKQDKVNEEETVKPVRMMEEVMTRAVKEKVS